jgi:hypothetical protein
MYVLVQKAKPEDQLADEAPESIVLWIRVCFDVIGEASIHHIRAIISFSLHFSLTILQVAKQ